MRHLCAESQESRISIVVLGVLWRHARTVCAKCSAPPIGQVIAIHRSNHHMAQAQFVNCCRHAGGFKGVWSIGQSCGDIAEATGTGTDCSQNHHRGVAFFASTRQCSDSPLLRKPSPARVRGRLSRSRERVSPCGAATRSQAGLPRRTGLSARCAFSGWRAAPWGAWGVPRGRIAHGVASCGVCGVLCGAGRATGESKE